MLRILSGSKHMSKQFTRVQIQYPSHTPGFGYLIYNTIDFPNTKLCPLIDHHTMYYPYRNITSSRQATNKDGKSDKPGFFSGGNKNNKKRKGLSQTLKDEFEYAQEYLNKFGNPDRQRLRNRDDIADTEEKWKEGGKAAAAVNATQPKEGEMEYEFNFNPNEDKKAEEEEEPDYTKMSEEEKKIYEAKQKEQEEINATLPVMVEEKITVWDQRFERLKEKWRSSTLFRSARKKKRELELSENPVIENIRDVKYDIEDQLEDWKEVYETSQHPVIYKLREAEDKILGETDIGWAVGELQRQDPGFDQNLFLEDMEEYMIPVVINAFLRPNIPMLKIVCEGSAARLAWQSNKERVTAGHTWDSRILDVDHVDMQKVIVVNNTPYVHLSFSCQHVHCIKDEKGEVVEGKETELKRVFYQWIMRRDFENPDFDWKIAEFHFHKMDFLA